MKELFVSQNDWDSHRPLLYVALQNTLDSFLELGCGHGSTPLIEQYCKENRIDFRAYDSDAEWAAKFPIVKVVKNIFLEAREDNDFIETVFVDSKPGEDRKDIIEYYKDVAKLIVCHDTEISSDYVYGMKKILASFKYRFDYKPEGKPATTVVSNFVDVSKWEI